MESCDGRIVARPVSERQLKSKSINESVTLARL